MEEEKEIFMTTPRRGEWKEEKFSEAKLHHRGGITFFGPLRNKRS